MTPFSGLYRFSHVRHWSGTVFTRCCYSHGQLPHEHHTDASVCLSVCLCTTPQHADAVNIRQAITSILLPCISFSQCVRVYVWLRAIKSTEIWVTFIYVCCPHFFATELRRHIIFAARTVYKALGYLCYRYFVHTIFNRIAVDNLR